MNTVYWKNQYTVQSDAGFFVRYTLECEVVVVDRDEMNRHDFSTDLKRAAVVDTWRNEVLKPKLEELRYSFRYMVAAQRGPQAYAHACRVITEETGDMLYIDPGCAGMVVEFRKIPSLKIKGLEIRFYCLHLHAGAKLANDSVFIEENYSMIKLRKLSAPEETPEFRKWEESCVVSLLRRRLQLEAEFKRREVEQTHTGRAFEIRTRVVGTTVELCWEKTSEWREGYSIQGYQKEGGGFSESPGLGSEGMCVIDSMAGVGNTHGCPVMSS